MKKILIITLCLMIITGCGKKTSKKTTTVKEDRFNTKVAQDVKVDDLKIMNINLKVNKDKSTLTADILNPTKKDIYVKLLNIKVKNSKGKVIANLVGYIGEDIKSNKTKRIISNINKDLSKAHSIEYEAVYK